MALKRYVRSVMRKLGFTETDKRVNEKILMLWGESLLSAKMMIWDSEQMPFVPENWDDYGFGVFSQNNEDGLLQYIIHHTKIPHKNFIEFGVEDYSECNTRFLLLHNNWKGYIMDGSKEAMDALKQQDLYWKRSIEAKGVFITKENINELIAESKFTEKVGLLSVDIDGNDYWVLEAIQDIKPQILICEYNPIYGAKEKVSIPYQDDFDRTSAHYSNLYWGASLAAFTSLLDLRDYKLVCINSLRNNAFYVKRDSSDLPEVSIEDAWQEALYRESRDKNGTLTFCSMEAGRKLIADMPVIDVVTRELKTIGDLKL